MPVRDKPFILVIDDEPDELLSLDFGAGLDENATAYVIHPHCVTLSLLEEADLVLVDNLLENWLKRDELSTISLQPANGLALAVVLREQVDKVQMGKLTAFALHTGYLGDICGRLPSATAEHVLARLNNLEWVFQKSESRRYTQITVLANAVRQLPSRWPTKPADSIALVMRLLSLETDGESSNRCWRDVQECRVPIHDSTGDGRGILFLRWLLHEVMPYPTFLWAEHWVAARLGICVDDLRNVVKGHSQLAQELKSMRYSGVLGGFLGDRWWRGALEDYVWELAGRHSAEGQMLLETLNERAGTTLTPIDADPAVVCLDRSYEPSGQFLTPITAVGLRPNHWPTFADPAWMDIEAVRDDPDLLSMVDPLDLYRFEASE